MEHTSGSIQGQKETRLPIPPEQQRKLSDIKDTITTWGENAKERTGKAVDQSVTYAKDHPLKTALGAGAIGFAIGWLSKAFK